MESKRVLVGLSGGVDSALTARLLMEKGYEVTGCYLRFCSESDPSGAKRVAKELGIPLTVVEARSAFQKKVIHPFVQTYREGKTPNPCVECNRKMKIAALMKEADRLGIFWVATGHYARIRRNETGRYQLLCGKDVNKDQSYFLWKLTQKQLSRLIFPLAEREKETVVKEADGLIPKDQKESMEVCFIPDGDTASFVEAYGGRTEEGDFVDSQGKVLGRHKGISRYTVGQRRGLGIAMGKRYFVISLDPEKNQVVLGPEEELTTKCVFAESLHWVSCTKKTLPEGEIFFRGRHRGKLLPCRLKFENGGVEVVFDGAQRRFAPGQSACFYHGETLLFGGKIAR